ncbi:hypothetical protein MEPL4_7c00580 [Melissococcus plutonius]|uniref:Uncharacterized protein n=2 Tax=Melissococcus plutonius TaxID=33970 RepID=F3YCP0_MELPT|nr:hypothetical protein MEPL_178p001160 [Melissococcus plutonius S1]KMT23590.1 hypothetical protein MEPL2_5c01100 [Melissococcus plutonius]BAK22268.1 hypothetical protein MPTP_1874 [Melissococcus plutonius ATCC 35311]KMT23642.1 hypothetical protein MEPL3_9c00350 [Melissococcus plutonius]KMT24277.1 hypothetical protein MEPL1_10c00260 [Melissococcus plutonius]
MIRRIECIRFSRNNYHVLISSFLLIIIGFSYYQFFLESPSRNFFSWILYNFQNLYTIGLAFPMFYLIIINSQFLFSLNNYNYISRLCSRRILFLSDVRTVFKATLLYLLGIIAICSMIGIFGLNLDNTWDKEIYLFFRSVLQTTPNKEFTPMFQAGLSILFLFMYLLTIGNCFNFLFTYFKKKSVGFVILLFLIGSQIYFYKVPTTSSFFNGIMPINHYILYMERFNENNGFISIGISLLYWIILFLINYGSLYVLYQRTDLGEYR